MRKILLPAAFLLAAPLFAQSHSVVFVGRFPARSLDEVNARPGSSITMIEEFDLAYVTPGPGAFARSWLPSTAHQAFRGDANNSGNQTFFRGFKAYFDRINFAGPFVKNADRASGDPLKVFWTVRDTIATHQFDVFTTNGTAMHTLRPGDFIRWAGNGNVEFFITQDQIMAAAGPQTGTFANGASAICQDAAGNLYYSPAEGGHWIAGNNFVNGNGNRVFANDGSIIMIDAANITYDASGNVASIVPATAHILWEEVSAGPLSGLSVRGMAANSNGQTATGALLTGYANTVGLDLDPNGGTVVAAYPVGEVPNQVSYTVPNLVWTVDNGTMCSTIFSTQNNGSIAVINGVQMGSNQTGIGCTGTPMGLVTDTGNFQPTSMGFCIMNAWGHEPLVLDMPNFGALENSTTQASWEIDVHGDNGQVVFLLFGMGPGTNSFAPSVPLALLPPVFTGTSFGQAFPYQSPSTLALLINDSFGYSTFSVPNPHTGTFAGMTLLLQAVGLTGNQFALSNPVQMQLK